MARAARDDLQSTSGGTPACPAAAGMAITHPGTGQLVPAGAAPVTPATAAGPCGGLAPQNPAHHVGIAALDALRKMR
ncbi:MAG TPA: hypothetical protein VJ803_02785 [Gemmatimonadaceae bacterium]|nr:hypothetical protein [Gemmatimonadaceae bacterium]